MARGDWMILIKGTTLIVLPGGITKEPGETFMCRDDYAQKLIAAGNAEVVNQVVPTNLEDLHVSELKELAERKGIELPKSITKKEIVKILNDAV